LDTHLPYIFGGLLSLLSESLKNRNSVRPTLKKLPRMADFAVVATAALGQDFYDAYQRNQESSTELALESSPIASAIKKLMTNREKWEGTPTELFNELNRIADGSAKTGEWARNASQLSKKLTRIAPTLRSAGIHYDRPHKMNGMRKLVLTKQVLG